MTTSTSTNALSEQSLERLTTWLLSEGVAGGPSLEVSAIGGGQGTANVMWGLQWGDQELVLRHPPLKKVTASAGSIDREALLLEALGKTAVPHAGFVAACRDPEVVGVPFLLMKRVNGYVPSDPLPALFGDAAMRNRIGYELVDGLAELAKADWRAIGLEGFGKPDGFLSRQIDRWLWQLESYQVRDVPSLSEVVGWLRANLPEPGPVGIMHGDYSTFNVMFAPGDEPKLVAILDWDTATIGEVLMDLGHLLSRWDEPGEEPTTLGSSDIAMRDGLASRQELAERYSAVTGIDVAGIRYYEVLSLFKLSCIMEGQYANYVNSGSKKPPGKYTSIGVGLMNDALRIARGEIH